jgi:hypothetical protein
VILDQPVTLILFKDKFAFLSRNMEVTIPAGTDT